MAPGTRLQLVHYCVFRRAPSIFTRLDVIKRCCLSLSWRWHSSRGLRGMFCCTPLRGQTVDGDQSWHEMRRRDGLLRPLVLFAAIFTTNDQDGDIRQHAASGDLLCCQIRTSFDAWAGRLTQQLKRAFRHRSCCAKQRTGRFICVITGLNGRQAIYWHAGVPRQSERCAGQCLSS